MEAKNLLRSIEERIIANPNDRTLAEDLKRVRNIFRISWMAEEKDFWRYAEELGAKVMEADYPHSIRTWYFSEFSPFLEEMKKDRDDE